MKKMLCLMSVAGLLFLRLTAAAEEYSPEDYATFVVMQRMADAHFTLAENINQQLRIEARKEDAQLCPGAYWFSDQRNTEPDPTQTMSLSQGLLFNPNTRTLYSRFGAWCFASEAMYKCAHSYCVPRTPKKNVWESFRTTLLKNYYIDLSKRQDPHEEYAVRRFYGTILPAVIFEEPLFGPSFIEASSQESISSLAEQPVLSDAIVQAEVPRGSTRRFFAFFSRLVGRWRNAHPPASGSGSSDEMISVLDIPQASSMSDRQPALCPRYTRDQERFLAVWREMKRRFDAENL